VEVPEKNRILLAEDESIVALDIKNRLVSLNYRITGHATTGIEAVELAEKTKPDLVLMDIKLNGNMDGIEAAEKIKAIVNVPVVFLTAFSDIHTLNRAIRTEPFGYLLKPFQEKELQIAIKMALYKHEMSLRLLESEYWLDYTIQSITEGLIACDEKERIKFLNPAAEKILGLPRNFAAGQLRDSIFIIEDPVPGPTDTRNFLVRRDGSRLPIERHTTVLKDKSGKIFGSVIVFRDISRQLSYEEELEKAKIEAEQANRVKGDFLAIISHELRTPMNSIIGAADLLKSGLKKSPEYEYIDIIRNSAGSLLFLINTILDFSKIEAQKMVLHQTAFKLPTILTDVREKLILETRTKRIGFSLESAGDCPESVNGDPRILEAILLNLAQNAVKFTDKGEVNIRVSLDRRDKMTLWLKFVVRDTGIGIPKDKLDIIFEPFTQGDSSPTRSRGGTGLGLALTKKLVDLLHGFIKVESELASGTVFTLLLPFSPADPDMCVSARDLSKNYVDPGVSEIKISDPAFRTLIVDLGNLLTSGDFNGMENRLSACKETFRESIPESAIQMLFRLRLSVRRKDESSARRLIEELDANTL
jgi:signal transduction histidine kinase